MKEGITKTPGDCIHTKLHHFLLQYRITLQTTTGMSPAELLNQQRPKTKLDLLHPNQQGKVQKQQSQMKMNHDKKADGKTIAVGDTVNIKNFCHGPKWMPGVVVKVTGPVSCEVLLSDERVVRRHVDHIQQRHTNQPNEVERQLPPSVPEVTHLPDDSHGTPECPLDNEIQPRQSEYPRDKVQQDPVVVTTNQSQFSPSPTESSQPTVVLTQESKTSRILERI